MAQTNIAKYFIQSGSTFHLRNIFLLLFVFSSITVFAQPANDNPCNAQPLSIGAVCNYTNSTNTGATATAGVSAPGCGNYAGGDVWFSVVVPASGAISFDSNTGVMTDGAMAIYSGTCGALTLISCDDDASANGLMPSLSVTGQTPGSTLFIRFWSYGNANNGSFSICATAPPVNDDPCGAIALPVSTTGCTYSTYSTANATNTSGVPAPGCGNYFGNDVWFTVTVPSSGAILFDSNTGVITDAAMAVYSGTSCNALTLLACNDDGSANGLMPSMTISNRTPGSTLWVRFWPWGNVVNGTFGLCATATTPLAPTNQDCPNALPICQNIYSTTNSYSGTGNIQNEINGDSSCLGAGELNDVWYTFTVQNSGNLNFTITPNNITEDYDWAVFNLTNASCADIATNSNLSVSCNFSATSGTTGPTGGSGLNSQDAFGTPYNAVVPVTAGQTYVVNVSNFTSSQNGYQINFGASTATIFDNIPPHLSAISSNIVCGSTQLTFEFSENILCSTIQNADFTLTGPGGPYTISNWSSPGCSAGGLYDRFVTVNISPAITTAGTYTLCLTNASASVTDLCGNVAPPSCMNFTINPILITSTQSNLQCSGVSTGSISVSPTSGVDPYSYVWSPNVGTTASISNLAAGTYTVTITDANGCHATQSVTLTQPATAVTGAITPVQPSCGATNGSASVLASGGTGPYTYAWSPSGGTGATASNLGGGNYSVTITDSHGCSTSMNTTLAAPTAPTALINSTTNASCLSPLGSMSVGVTGGTAPYTYSWSPSGGNAAAASNLQPGAYTCIVTDAAGCSSSATATIGVPPVINANILATVNPGCNGAANGSATASGANGLPNYAYSWTPSGGNAATASGLIAGTYTVTVTDAQGCTASATATLSAPPPVTASATSIPALCNGGATGSATALASGTGTLTYSWSPSGGTAATATNLSAGNYTVTVHDINGCSATASVAVAQPTILSLTTTTLPSVCGQNSGAASAIAAGGTPIYIYSWSPSGGSGDTATNLATGTYVVTVTDDNGCTTSASVSIASAPGPTATISSTLNPACFGLANGTATAGGSGGTAPLSYSWSSGGGTSATATGLAAGTYTVTVSDANGCTSTTQAVISQPSQLSASITSATNILCAGTNNGASTVSPTGGSPGYTYSWSPSGGTAATAVNLSQGTYTVTVTDANGCTSTATTSITEPLPITATVNNTPVICSGGSNGTAIVNASGGTNPLNYAWSPSGGTAATASNLAAGNYSVTITDANGCSTSASVIITQPSAMTASIASTTNVNCNGASNGSANATVSGGSPAYTYIWSPSGGSSATANGLSAGNYSVIVTDANGCTATSVAIITEPTAVVNALLTSTNVSCNGLANGSASVNASGGTAAYTYTWSPSGGTSSSALNLIAGTYTITATDANGCTATATATITDPPVLTATLQSTNVLCAGGANGSAQVTVVGGTANYTYSWSPSGGLGTSATGLSAGTYTATITDANGCTTTTTTTISEPLPVTASASSSPAFCNGGSTGSATAIAGGGTAGYTYSWAPSGGNGATANGLSAGSFTVTITDANGCTSSATTSVTEPNPIVVNLSSTTNATCFGSANGTATVSSSGGTPNITYVWSPSGGNAAIASGLSAGSYSVIATDANGCTGTTMASITQPTQLISNILSSTNVSCNGLADGTASLNASGGTPNYSYNWIPGNSTSVNPSGLAAGTYTVTITDANGCTSTASTTISQPSVITAIVSPSAAHCNGSADGSALVTATGGTPGFTYIWFPSGGTASSETNLAAGNYSVTVTDANGCTNSVSTIVTQPSAIILTTTSTPATCGSANGSANVTTSGGASPYAYSWSPSGGIGSGASSLIAGSYSVMVTDANGCTSSAAANVSNTGGPVISASVSNNVSCNGGTNGSAVVTVSSGTGPYTFQWSPSGGSSANATNLSAGNYSITVNDANGCISTGNISITEPGPLALQASGTNVSCAGYSNGSASVQVAGGTSPYTYAWNPGGGNSAQATNLIAGNYSVTVTDANGCTQSTSTAISQPTPLTTSITSTPTNCSGNPSGTATVTANGGSGSFSYVWSPSGGSNNTATALSAGNYTVTITDANGCTTSLSTVVTQPTSFTLTTSTTSATCGASNGSASANLTGGTGPFTYSWTPSGGNTASVSNLSAGTYMVTVSDANGCSSTANVSVTSAGGPSVNTNLATPLNCFGSSNGVATVSVSNGTGPFTYNWSPSGGNSATASNLGAGTYTVSVSDANGCTSSASITLNQPAAMILQTNTNPVNCFGGSNGSVSVSVSGGSPTYTYNWQPGNASSSSAAGMASGNYIVTVTDAAGCSMTASALVSQPAALTIVTTPTPASCNGSSNGSLLATPSGGIAGYSYSWFPGGGTNSTASSLSAGNYTVTITDANGCSATASSAVTEPIAISLSTSTTPASCGSSNGSAVVVASGGAGGFSYIWQPAGGASASATNIIAGSYTVVVTDANGCSTSASASVSNTGGPTITASVLSDVSCFGGNNGSATVSVTSGTAPYIYQWTPGGSSSVSATNLVAGNYSVNVIDANGCISVSNVIISQPTILAVQATSTPVSCAGYADGTATAQAAGGISPYSYEWNPGSVTSIHATNLSAGNYSVTVTDANNCSLSASTAITQPSALSTTISSTPASCFGAATGSAVVNVNGGSGNFTYSWSPSGGNNNSASNLFAGNYSVIITDANGCTTSVSTAVGQAASMTIATSNTPSSCGSSNGSANANPSGGTAPYQYSWSPSGGNGATANNIAAGSYIVTITDANGCSASASTLISNTGGPTISLSASTNVSCNGGSDGSAGVNASGGTSPYSYNWRPYGGSAATAVGLSAGNYSVVVADANGCQSLFNVTIAEPAAITIQSSSTPATCVSNNGSASINVSGGTGNYTYSWNGLSGTSNSVSGIAAGNYSVTVTDGAGCTQNTIISVASTGGANAILQNSTDVSCNGGSNGTAIISTTSGTAPFTYSWSPIGGNAASASGLQAGSYVVIVSDASGCSTTVNVVIGEPDPISLQTSSTPASCNGGTDGSISVVVNGGQSPYSFLWQGISQTTSQVTGLGIGNYTVIVTDANGCIESSISTINSSTPIALNTVSGDVSCFGASNGNALVNPQGGTPPYTFAWSPSGGNSASASNLPGGLYSILVTDANGCASIDNIVINEPSAILLSTLPTVNLCVGQSTLLEAIVSGGTQPYTYQWSNGIVTPTQSVSPSATANYSVTVTDANGCSGGTQSINVIINAPLSVVAGNPVVICEGSNALLTSLAQGGDGNYTYSWSNGITGTDQTVTPAGSTIYTISVTDGCGSPPAVASVSITVDPAPQASFGPYSAHGCAPVTVNFNNQSVAPAGSTYSWQFGDSGTSGDLNPVHTYTAPGIYTVDMAITSPGGCGDSQTSINLVEVFANPTASFTSTPEQVTLMDNDVMFSNTSTNGETYTWNFGDGSTEISSLSPSHEYSDTGYFDVMLIAMSSNGCLDTSFGVIHVEEDFTIFIPNAFTPNSDNVNDAFNAYGIGWKDYNLYILDRWGLNIYHTTDPSKPWDGSYESNGNPCEADVYVYKIQVHDTEGKLHSFIGHVSLVR